MLRSAALTVLATLPTVHTWRLGDLETDRLSPSLVGATADHWTVDYLKTLKKNALRAQDAAAVIEGQAGAVETSPLEKLRYVPQQRAPRKLTGQGDGEVQSQAFPPVIFTLAELQFLLGVFSIDPPKMVFTIIEDYHAVRQLDRYRSISNQYLSMPAYKTVHDFVMKLIRGRRARTRALSGTGGDLLDAGLNAEVAELLAQSVNAEQASDILFGLESQSHGLDNVSATTQAVLQPAEVETLDSTLKKLRRGIDPHMLKDLLLINETAEDMIAKAIVADRASPLVGQSEADEVFDPYLIYRDREEVEAALLHYTFNLCDWIEPHSECTGAKFTHSCIKESGKRWNAGLTDLEFLPHLRIGQVNLPRSPFKALRAILEMACNPWVDQLHADGMVYNGDAEPLDRLPGGRNAGGKPYRPTATRWQTTTSTRVTQTQTQTTTAASSSTDAATPNDPYYSKQWHIPDQKVDTAWSLNKGSEDVVTMVADTGAQADHPDLEDSFWTNPSPGTGNYGNDVHGINTIDNSADFSDAGSHGTHMCGIVAATTNNSVGVAGVGRNCKLCPCKFMGTSSGQLSNLNKCIEYAISKEFAAISMSFGGNTALTSTKKAIASATTAGIFMAAASGDTWQDNDSNPVYPASYSTETGSALVSVGGYCQNGTLIDYGGYGATSVQIAGPGSYVYATGVNSKYEYRGGTSPAVPNIAGVAALVKSANSKLTGLEIKNIIKATVQTVSAYSGYNAWSGKANAYSAVQKATSS